MPEIITLAEFAMGTRFELVLIGDDRGFLLASGREALDEVLLWHSRLSAFDRASAIARLNAAAGGDWVALDAETFAFLHLARSIAHASLGAFDPTIGPLMRAWGHRGVDANVSDLALIPTGFEGLELDPARSSARLHRPGMALDLGAIGKGWALDRAADILRSLGITSALLHGGTSSVLAIGAPPGESAWRVRLNGPRSIVANLRNASLGVSAPAGRTGASPTGESLGHIIDPRTRRPTDGSSLAACLGPSAAEADAWSTAALVEAVHPSGAPSSLASLIVRPDGTIIGPCNDHSHAFTLSRAAPSPVFGAVA